MADGGSGGGGAGAAFPTFARSLALGLALVAVLSLSLSKAFAQLERLSYDVRMRMTASPGRTDPRIVVCEIDDVSLREFEMNDGIGWPWPRGELGKAVRFLREGGAAAVVFDVLFNDPSRFLDEDGPYDDREFATDLREAGGVVLATPFSPDRVPDFSDVSIRSLALAAEAAPPGLPTYVSAQPPIPELAAAAAAIGNVTVRTDPDGVVRRLPIAVRLGERVYPSLALSTARLLGGARAVPLDRSGNLAVRFHGPARTYRRISFWKLLRSRQQMLDGEPPLLDPRSFRGKVVFVGATAQGLYDLKTTPMGGHQPGVEVHAAMLDNLLHGEAIVDRTANLAWALVLAAPVAVLSALAGAGTRSLLQSLGLWFLLMAGALACSLWAFASGLAVPISLPLLAATVCYASSSSLHHLGEARKRRQIERAFSQYLHPEVVKALARDPGKLRLGGEEREMTVLFSDIAGFTPIAERLEAQAMVSLLSEYLTEMSEILHQHRGTLDKYIGDGIMAFWGAPLPQAEHAALACEAALDCQSRLREMGASLAARGLPPLSARIGINTGRMNVGNMGSRMLFNYTVQGDAVNLASRLEGAGKVYGVGILVGEETARQASGRVVLRELDLLRVVGREAPVRLDEVGCRPPEETAGGRLQRESFATALAAYRASRWDEAEERFRGILSAHPGDAPSRLYLERIGEHRSEPPPEDWDGVHDLSSK